VPGDAALHLAGLWIDSALLCAEVAVEDLGDEDLVRRPVLPGADLARGDDRQAGGVFV